MGGACSGPGDIFATYGSLIDHLTSRDEPHSRLVPSRPQHSVLRCTESLAFEVAADCDIPSDVVDMAVRFHADLLRTEADRAADRAADRHHAGLHAGGGGSGAGGAAQGARDGIVGDAGAAGPSGNGSGGDGTAGGGVGPSAAVPGLSAAEGPVRPPKRPPRRPPGRVETSVRPTNFDEALQGLSRVLEADFAEKIQRGGKGTVEAGAGAGAGAEAGEGPRQLAFVPLASSEVRRPQRGRLKPGALPCLA